MTGRALVEYKTLEIRASLTTEKHDAEGLAQALNDEAKDGWRLRTITETKIGGRLGRGTTGLLVVLERHVTQ